MNNKRLPTCPKREMQADVFFLATGAEAGPSEMACNGAACPGPQYVRTEVLGVSLPFPRFTGHAVCGQEVEKISGETAQDDNR